MLSVEVSGSGPELVMVHGWGMHSGVWSDWAEELSRWFRVHLVDLPGHGNSPYDCGTQLADWAAAVAQVTPSDAWWLGWSLGGLVSLRAAGACPRKVRGLVLLATTPRFVASSGWSSAVDATIFEQFAQQLYTDAERTLTRFLSLQVRSAEGGGATLRELRSRLNTRPQPLKRALRDGLGFLQRSDMRGVLEDAKVPVFWMLGEHDTLVPAGVRAQFSNIPWAIIEGAGHAPFLSHPGRCTGHIKSWLLSDAGQKHHVAG
jgi:pimeloyl-[acyl-carrier protein] methyl ester esterase